MKQTGKGKKMATVISAAAIFFGCCTVSESAPPWAASGPYFGQTPPGATPRLFAPEIISLSNRLEGPITFSPDAAECYFTVWNSDETSGSIYYTVCVNDTWTAPAEAPFSVGRDTRLPSFSADGSRLSFEYNGNKLWYVQRMGQGWSDPQTFPAPINSDYAEYCYVEAADGDGYFASSRPGGLGSGDIWRTRRPPGQPLEAEALSIVNSAYLEYAPCIAPDESYLIFTSARPGGFGDSDLYVSFADGSGGFNAPVNMNDYCPGIRAYPKSRIARNVINAQEKWSSAR